MAQISGDVHSGPLGKGIVLYVLGFVEASMLSVGNGFDSLILKTDGPYSACQTFSEVVS